jgi:phage tail-like protein
VDANLQRLHPLAARAAWRIDDARDVAWDARARLLRLVGTRAPRWTEAPADGEARRLRAPGAIDRFGTRARVALGTDGFAVKVTGARADEVTLLGPGVAPITDVAVGADDVLYVAIGGAVRMHDLRDRWDDVTVTVAGGAAWRLAPRAGGGVHVAIVDAATKVVVLGEVLGHPLRRIPHRFGDDVFRPEPEEPDPPRFSHATPPPAPGVAAIATSPDGRLAALSWSDNADAALHVRTADGWRTRTLIGARGPYSLAWLDYDRVAVLIATAGGGTVAAVYTALAKHDPPAAPVGDLYPLRDPAPEPFVHVSAAPPIYIGAGDAPRELLPLSWPAYAGRGEVRAVPVDGAEPGARWHRIYLEAAIPAGCSITVWLAAGETADEPAPGDWFPHRFGEGGERGVPRGAWVRAASELPFHRGHLGCTPRPGVAGLFTALVQRSGRRTRTLTGRFLHVRVELTGDGRATPELASLRLYSNRRAYAGLYLPELYREDTFGPDADEAGAATQPDFLDRFLGLFESVLTPLEDRIAGAWLLTHPRTTSDDALDWLASWVGFVFAADLPVARRRAMLEEAWPLYQRRGTFAGLRRALELASGGGIDRRDIVVVEDFRLRRTFATILGADLTDPDDPLTPGLSAGGNSIVGDTLILGAEERRGFLALFDADQVAGDRAIDELFEKLAHRVTVLVHQEVEPHDLGLIRQVIALEAPAHVEVKVVTATDRFRVAVSSLVGVDTYLGPRPPPAPLALDRSLVGVADSIARLPSLDPRLGRTS